MKHILIIGGTGMLWGVSEHFIRKGYKVSLMARGEDALIRLRALSRDPDKVQLLKQDYRYADEAMGKMEDTVNVLGPIDTAVLWIHDSGKKFGERLKKFLVAQNSRVEIFELFGSAAYYPENLLSDTENYRKIILGYVKEEQGSRWLGNDEISAGTIAAIDEDKPKYVIGITSPWDERP